MSDKIIPYIISTREGPIPYTQLLALVSTTWSLTENSAGQFRDPPSINEWGQILKSWPNLLNGFRIIISYFPEHPNHNLSSKSLMENNSKMSIVVDQDIDIISQICEVDNRNYMLMTEDWVPKYNLPLSAQDPFRQIITINSALSFISNIINSAVREGQTAKKNIATINHELKRLYIK